MTYHKMDPPAQLRKYVQYFWEGEIEMGYKQAFTHISTAATCPELLFYYKGGFSRSKNAVISDLGSAAIFQGQTNLYADYITNDAAGIFGVHFYPYAIPALFSMPASELTNQMLDLSTLLGHTGKQLEEQIFSASNMLERVAIISLFLAAKFEKDPNNDPNVMAAMHTINAQNGSINTMHLAKQCYLSQRQFERKFKEVSGFTPKSYAKIVRFEYAMNCFLYHPQPLTEIALACGYYDQAHFNHDFKTLSGYNPKEYYQNVAQTIGFM